MIFTRCDNALEGLAKLRVCIRQQHRKFGAGCIQAFFDFLRFRESSLGCPSPCYGHAESCRKQQAGSPREG
jgi:hypothetical protein